MTTSNNNKSLSNQAKEILAQDGDLLRNIIQEVLQEILEVEMDQALSGRHSPLLDHAPLRTKRAIFTAFGSSLRKARSEPGYTAFKRWASTSPWQLSWTRTRLENVSDPPNTRGTMY